MQDLNLCSWTWPCGFDLCFDLRVLVLILALLALVLILIVSFTFWSNVPTRIMTFAMMHEMITCKHWSLQANVHVLVNNWHVKRSSSFSSHCCKISTSDLQKDRTILMCMKRREQQLRLQITKLEWLQEMCRFAACGLCEWFDFIAKSRTLFDNNETILSVKIMTEYPLNQ